MNKFIKRRTFLSGLATFSTAAALSPPKAQAFLQDGDGKTPPRDTFLALPTSEPPFLPPKLQAGSRIGIVSPAGGVTNKELRNGLEAFKTLKLHVTKGKSIHRGYGYLAASDEERAREFMEFVQRPDIDAIWCSRGGYGIMRILELLDFEVIRNNPKPIIGYSDITALVNAVYKKSGLVAFHGAVASSSFDDYTMEHLRHSLFGKTLNTAITPSSKNTSGEFKNTAFTTLHGGTATGRLVGGNLSIVTALLGTPFQIPLAGNILFLEEIKEEPYRIDRMITQLLLTGELQQCAGIAIGRFTKCKGQDPRTRPSLEDMLRERMDELKEYNIPIIYGLPIGHIISKMMIPVGVLAELNADKGTLTYQEPTVSDDVRTITSHADEFREDSQTLDTTKEVESHVDIREFDPEPEPFEPRATIEPKN
jgi:muramoyltetrapeptide carboxypeptidase